MEYSEMTTNVLVSFYSTCGHVHRMALAVVEGAESVPDITVRLRPIAKLEEARKALSAQDTPTCGHSSTGRHSRGHARRFALGRWHCLRDADPLWQHERADEAVCRHHGRSLAQGELEDKATGIFTSTATIHGGQETTILTALVPLIHLGMVFVGTPYGQNPQILVTDGIGGSPYGPGTLAGTDGSRQPVEAELTTARNLGSRLARVASCLKDLRVSRVSAPLA
jgi:NAD(P)H dehydrogenase (quinone)